MMWLGISGLLLILFLALFFFRFRRKRMEKEWVEEMERRHVARIVKKIRASLLV